MLFADLRGINSHGALRVEHYINRIIKGGINLDSAFKIKKIKPSIALMDAHGGFGHVANKYAMEWAIETSREQGVAVIGVKNNSHCGALSYYTSLATADKKIGFICTNSDACVAPIGGTRAFFGTNALSYGVPALKDNDIADMATSEVALGKILNIRSKGESMIPSNWGIDENGNMTTDANKIKYLLPFGGHKGYVIMAFVEMLSGVLMGEVYGAHLKPMYSNLEEKRNLSTFMFVIDPGIFNNIDSFLRTMQSFIDDLRLEPTKDNKGKIKLPGDGANARLKENLINGISISEEVYNFLFS